MDGVTTADLLIFHSLHSDADVDTFSMAASGDSDDIHAVQQFLPDADAPDPSDLSLLTPIFLPVLDHHHHHPFSAPSASSDLFHSPSPSPPIPAFPPSPNRFLHSSDLHLYPDTPSTLLELGLGPDSSLDPHSDIDVDVESPIGHGFFVGDLRSSQPAPDDGLRIVGLESDSYPDEDLDLNSDWRDWSDDRDRDPSDRRFHLPLDDLRLEYQREDPDEDFDWEEIEIEGDDRAADLGMMVGGSASTDEGRGSRSSASRGFGSVGDAVVGPGRSFEWQVLWSIDGLQRNVIEIENVDELNVDEFIGEEEHANAAEYEVLLGQLVGDDDLLPRGTPPAARSAINCIETVVLTKEDIESNNGLCAVCKDEFSPEGRVKWLPCSHYYHGDCILPWLRIRNTCPVCRYELWTDDLSYEQHRARRAGEGIIMHAPEDSYYEHQGGGGLKTLSSKIARGSQSEITNFTGREEILTSRRAGW